jgi:hypothetical protein
MASGEMAVAEQRARRCLAGLDGGGDTACVEARAGAHRTGTTEIHHQHADRAVGLGLQDKAAFDLERGTQQHRQRDSLAEQPGNRQGIIVARENLVHGRSEPDHAAAEIEGCDLERLDGIVGGCRCRCAHRNVGLRLCHFAICSARQRKRDPRPDIGHCARRHQAKMPFWACRRFSASSNTTDCGPSITSSETSSPRCAGKQCMNSASGLALAISRALTW